MNVIFAKRLLYNELILNATRRHTYCANLVIEKLINLKIYRNISSGTTSPENIFVEDARNNLLILPN
jgi:hypothetical protein